jgi:phage nucleotide-binding protein
MAVALIYGPAGAGKTTNSTLVKGGYVGIENGKLKQYKEKGKIKLLCSDNSSIVLANFNRPNLDIEATWNWCEKDKLGKEQECFNTQFRRAVDSNVYDTIIVDNITSIFNNAIIELDDSGKYKDMRQAYSLIYNGLRRLVWEAAQAKTNVIFTAWHNTEDYPDPTTGVMAKRITPKLPMKVMDDFIGMCNICAYINTADRDGQKAWYYTLEGSPTMYAKDQLYVRKSCMPEDIFTGGGK